MPKNPASLSTYTTMMRVNSKGRPYAKDLYDIYSALLIQQPLTDHRSFFRNYPSTFTTDEAVESLSHLQFTHLVSTPNPLDPSHPLLTRTTTTFSMSRDMAKTLGQHFIHARLSENATDPQNRTMKDKGIWSPTPKGKFMIQDFSQRARVSIKHMQAPLARIHNFQIVQFERLLDDDQLSFSRPNMIQAFKVMMEWLPTNNLMIDDIGGETNQNVIEAYRDTFFGYQCFEWIMEYTSVVSNEETELVAAEFVLYGWIQQVMDKSDKDLNRKDESAIFKTGRKTQYYLTDKGRHIIDGDGITVHNHPFSSLSTGGGISLATARSRTQSSTTSSSSSSIMTNNSNSNKFLNNITPIKPTRKEDYVSRLLPTTAESVLSDNATAPKAIITKEKTVAIATDSAVAIMDTDDEESLATRIESAIHIDNSSCDFGFSSASSVSSSIASTICPPPPVTTSNSNNVSNNSSSNRSVAINSNDIQQIHEHLEKLKVSSATVAATSATDLPPHQSQISRLNSILYDPLIRMYFRQFLKSSFCEENINFWVDYTTLVKKIGLPAADDDDDEKVTAKDRNKRIEQLPSALCESLLSHCCVIYNTYFCPVHAASELNIDHGLRYDIIQYMQSTFTSSSYSKTKESGGGAIHPTVAAGPDAPFGSISVSSNGILTSSSSSSNAITKNGIVGATSILKAGVKDSPQHCLCKIIHLYEMANEQVCNTMAQDSVPRFIKTQKYHDLMQSYYQRDESTGSEEEEEEYDDDSDI